MIIKKLVVKAITLFALCLPFLASQAFEARVVGVSDGDTITVLDSNKTQYKIRVAGIDAPEKAQDYGNRAKEHLSDLIFWQNCQSA